MKPLIYITLILMLSISKRSNPNCIYLDLAKAIIEQDDKVQLKSLEQKIATFQKDSTTVFLDGWYYYDTVNQEYQYSRGTTDQLKKNIYWFLLIDNLHFGHYTWEIDWKQPENEIIGIINTLAKKKNYLLPEIPSAKDKRNIDAGGRLAFYNTALKKNGYTLINFNIDSDSYIIALIKKENFRKISILAQMTGNSISEY